jgi:glyoxylase-like metal-dependent hydrolase (beta-lactamase superfamily II)
MFGVVPKVLWSKTNPADRRNRVELASRVLLLRGRGRTILVDTGMEAKFTTKQRRMYRLQAKRHHLLHSLAATGVDAGDVTDVILTHLHFDHAGGATVLRHGEPSATFPNARYYVQRRQWQHALCATERDRASFLADDFAPLKKAGRLQLLDGACELFPCIRLLVFHGHTPGLQLPRIGDGKRTLFLAGELFPTVAHLRVPWLMAYDLRPLEVLEEKQRLLAQIARERWTVVFQHDPHTVSARVRACEKGFEVVPGSGRVVA